MLFNSLDTSILVAIHAPKGAYVRHEESYPRPVDHSTISVVTIGVKDGECDCYWGTFRVVEYVSEGTYTVSQLD